MLGLSMFLLYAAPSNAEWSATTEAKMLFTDNVYELSASRRLALSEDPSQPVRVSLDKPSDVVWQPTIDLRRASSTRAGLTELSFKADGFLYTNNPLFNHGPLPKNQKRHSGFAGGLLPSWP